MKIETYKPISVELHLKICEARVEEKKELSDRKVNAKGELTIK